MGAISDSEWSDAPDSYRNRWNAAYDAVKAATETAK